MTNAPQLRQNHIEHSGCGITRTIRRFQRECAKYPEKRFCRCVLQAHLQRVLVLGQVRSLIDPAAAKHQIAIVEHGRLPRSHRTLRFIEAHLDA